MFTGIVKGTGQIVAIDARSGLSTLSVQVPQDLSEDLEEGASIALDGVCLTVIGWQGNVISFDAMQETLAITTLGSLKKGDSVNIERAARGNVEIGGHELSGHIDTTARIVALERPENNYVLTFSVPPPTMRYIFPKGYIGLNGCSLTVTDSRVGEGMFSVWFIPETLRRTTFGEKGVGSIVNVEIDRRTQVIVDTVERVVTSQLEDIVQAVLSRPKSN